MPQSGYFCVTWLYRDPLSLDAQAIRKPMRYEQRMVVKFRYLFLFILFFYKTSDLFWYFSIGFIGKKLRTAEFSGWVGYSQFCFPKEQSPLRKLGNGLSSRILGFSGFCILTEYLPFRLRKRSKTSRKWLVNPDRHEQHHKLLVI